MGVTVSSFHWFIKVDGTIVAAQVCNIESMHYTHSYVYDYIHIHM